MNMGVSLDMGGGQGSDQSPPCLINQLTYDRHPFPHTCIQSVYQLKLTQGTGTLDMRVVDLSLKWSTCYFFPYLWVICYIDTSRKERKG